MAVETAQEAYVRRVLWYRPIAFYQLADPFTSNGAIATDEVGDHDGVYVTHNDATHAGSILKASDRAAAPPDGCNPPAGIVPWGSVEFSGGIPTPGLPNAYVNAPIPDLTAGDFTVLGVFEGAASPLDPGLTVGGCQGAHGLDLSYERPDGSTGTATSVLNGGLVGNLSGATGSWQGWALFVSGGYYDLALGVPLDNVFDIIFQLGDVQLNLGMPGGRTVCLQKLGSQIRGAWHATGTAVDWISAPLPGAPDAPGPGVTIGTVNFNRALSGYWGNLNGDGAMADWAFWNRALSDHEIIELLACGAEHPADVHAWARSRGTVEAAAEPAGVGGSSALHFDAIPGGDPT